MIAWLFRRGRWVAASLVLVTLFAGCGPKPPSVERWVLNRQSSRAELATVAAGEQLVCSLAWLPARFTVGEGSSLSAVLNFDLSKLRCEPAWATELLAGSLLLDVHDKQDAILAFEVAERQRELLPAGIELCGVRRTVPLTVVFRRVDANTLEIKGEVELQREWFGMSFERYRVPGGTWAELDPVLVLRFTALVRGEPAESETDPG